MATHCVYTVTDHAMTDHATGIAARPLDAPRCFKVLSGAAVGRLGFSASALPVIVRVNFVIQHQQIILASGEPQVIEAARSGAVACLQVDQPAKADADGWCVLATGRLHIASRSSTSAMAALPVDPWRLTHPDAYLELDVEIISGQLFEARPAG